MFVLFIFTSISFGTEFKLNSFNRYGAVPSMELSLYSDNANTLDEIFNVLEFSRDKLHLRLIGSSSEKTNKELADYYFDKFHYWKGDLRKEPKLVKPLFTDALRSTSLFKKLKQKLNEHGYQVTNISFEKLSFSTDKISIPDVYITCVKSA